MFCHPAFVPRTMRIEYPGAIYHVMNRGDRQEPIFEDDPDRERFLEILAETCFKTGWQVHAYCLMGNHFHLVAETPQANLVAGMQWFLSTYTARSNRRHRRFGHLFSGRYKSLKVIPRCNSSSARAERNPVRRCDGVPPFARRFPEGAAGGSHRTSRRAATVSSPVR